MPIYKGKFRLIDAAEWEEVVINLQTQVEAEIPQWIGQLRLTTSSGLLGHEAGELSLADGRTASILLNGITEDLTLSQPLYKFLVTSPFSSA